MIQVNLLPSSTEISKLIGLLSSDLREEVFFSRLSGEVLGFIGGDHAEIHLCYNDNSTKLIAKDGEAVKGALRLKSGHGPSGYVAKSKRAYYSNSVQSDPLFSGFRTQEVLSEIVLPLNIEGNILGTLHIQSTSKDKTFNEDSLAQLKNFIASVEAPLRNINLYLMAKFLNDELTYRLENQVKIEKKPSASTLGKVEVLGQDEKILKAISLAKKVASQDFPVLIQGKVGVGKRLLSKKVHVSGQRAESPFFIVECKTHSEDALEKELFGFEDRLGIWELCAEGTIVLNDVNFLSARLQSKILNIMTTGLCKKFHSNKPFSVNARIITTSQYDLKDLVVAGKFREDLYYRLSTVTIEVPSLSERKGDIRLLAQHFLNEGKSEKKVLTNKAFEQLEKYSWKSNIIELRNVMERTYALTDAKYIDEVEMNGSEVLEESPEHEAAYGIFTLMPLQDLEKMHICKTLDHLNGNKTRTAKALGVTVKTLYNKLHSYDLITKTAQ